MSDKPVITVVGAYCVDIFFRSERFPAFGETLIADMFHFGPGGKGANQAVGVARSGGQCHFVGMIGDDPFAPMALKLFEEEGVGTRYLGQSKTKGTAVGLALVNQAGENSCLLDMMANELVDADWLDQAEEQIARSDLLLTSMEIPISGVIRSLELARKHKVRTILNPAPAVPLSPDQLKLADVLTPNESELRILNGLEPDACVNDLELATGLQDKGAHTIVLTRGADGALLLQDGEWTEIPSQKVDAIDTTGAGDAFNATLAVALAEGQELCPAIELANSAGAYACTKVGCVPGLAHRHELKANT
jgi:ribokinase